MERDTVRESVMNRDDDAGDEKSKGHNNVWSSPHLARNVGKMLSNVAMMICGVEGYCVGNCTGWSSN
jgi:hypothetical protein